MVLNSFICHQKKKKRCTVSTYLLANCSMVSTERQWFAQTKNTISHDQGSQLCADSCAVSSLFLTAERMHKLNIIGRHISSFPSYNTTLTYKCINLTVVSCRHIKPMLGWFVDVFSVGRHNSLTLSNNSLHLYSWPCEGIKHSEDRVHPEHQIFWQPIPHISFLPLSDNICGTHSIWNYSLLTVLR